MMHMHAFTRPEDRARIHTNEVARVAYQRRRHAELEAAGVELDEARRIVDDEVRAGLALQAQPAVITRTGGAA